MLDCKTQTQVASTSPGGLMSNNKRPCNLIIVFKEYMPTDS